MADLEYQDNTAAGLPGVGGSVIHLGPKVARLTAEGILELCTTDPTDPMIQGRLLSRQQQITHPDAHLDRKLVEIVRAAGEGAEPPERGTYAHPVTQAEARFADLRHEEQQALTPAFIRFVEGLPDDASEMDQTAIDAVVRAWMQAPELDRPFLRPVIDRIRRYHDLEAERAELRAEVANASRPGRVSDAMPHAAHLLAQRIREEAPDLTEAEALARAADQVGQAVGRHDAELSLRAERAQARLSELLRGADPKSSARHEPEFDSYQAGRRHGERERRKAERDPLAGFRRIEAT